MPADASWQISAPRRLDFERPIREVTVRLINGTVNVVGTAEPTARLETGEVLGPPLRVRRSRQRLDIRHDERGPGQAPWWRERKYGDRSAVVSLSVPAGVRLTVRVVRAHVVVSGISGSTHLQSVSGDTTLVEVSGPVRAETVSGSVETQGLTGPLRYHSVSGDLTVVNGGGSAVRAESINGDLILDLDPVPSGSDVQATTVSGEIAVRLSQPANATVEASSTTGRTSNAFDELRMSGQGNARRITGTLGTGEGRLRALTVSGPLALLRRPRLEEDRPDDGAASAAPSLGKEQ